MQKCHRQLAVDVKAPTAGARTDPGPGDERKTAAPRPGRARRAKRLDAGPFAADIASFRLHLAAENKAAGTIRIYTDAVRWFAAAHLLGETEKTRWKQVNAADVQEWVVCLLGRYSEGYAYQQYRSLQQFFRWLKLEVGLPSPMAKLRPPKVTDKPVPFFTSVELSRLDRSGICQLVVRRGKECGVRLYPHRFRHHFAYTWLDRGGAEGDLMELSGWVSPQMLTRYGASARGARARRSYDRVMSG